jgi:hypothetical protein
MAFGPGGLLDVMTVDKGQISFVYDASTRSLSSPVNAAPDTHGIGIAFHGADMYLTSMTAGRTSREHFRHSL